MYLHMAAYAESLGSVTNSDVDAAADDVLQRRNSHLIFSEPFNLLAAYGSSTTLTRARFGNVALTVRGTNHLWPLDRTDTIQRYPSMMDMRERPLELPMNEEITIEATTDAAGPIVAYFGLFLAKPQWTPALPAGLQRFITRCTATIVAATATTWSAPAAVVLERDLYNGVYAVVGANVVLATGKFFRLTFPSQPSVEGRQLRPGGLLTTTTGLSPWWKQDGMLGEWGRFHTFEPPSIQVFGDAAGGTAEIRLDLIYLGQDVNLLKRAG